MQILRSLTALSIVALIGACSVASQAARTTTDEDAIHELLARFERAFAERSGELYASSFTEDADWENAFGSREEGRSAIERRLTGVYTMYQDAGREDQEPRIVFITDDVAVADRVSVYQGQVGTRDQPLPPRRVRNTYVLRKVGGAWHVALYRGADLRGSVDVPR